MRITDKINTLIHPWMTSYVMRAYARKSKKVEKKHPELFNIVDKELSRQHRELWSRLGVRSGDRWLRLHVNLTGIADYTFCPEDIFFARIERMMNDCDESGHGPDDKSGLFRFVPRENRPETILRYVRGNFFDAENNWINECKANELLQGELIGKPCRNCGGNGVVLRDDFSANWIKCNGGDVYEVQRKIHQCEFTAQFNSSSINTVRMMTMRCPWDGKIIVCRSMLRMGVSNAVIDNMMKGGICVCVGDMGQFGKYAYDYDGKRFDRHPVSGLTFEGKVHPGYTRMKEVALSIHKNILSFNLLSFDLVQREDGSICVIEINATSQGITQLQYDFGGLFGEYTEQVVEWCANHFELDRFSHFRTWY